MGRKEINHPAIEAVARARQQFLTWREEFPERVKVLRAQQREHYVHHMEDALLEAHDLGASVRYLMDVYGTKDSRYINKMIENARLRRDAEEQAWDELTADLETMNLEQQPER